MTLTRLQRALNSWLWPVRLVGLVVLLGLHGPIRWLAGAFLFASIAVDAGVWSRDRHRRRGARRHEQAANRGAEE
jgi:hypothetical protein